MRTEVINKIIITEEAVFDYEESLGLGRLDKKTLKAEVEEYIDIKNRSSRLLWENYFRCNYFDEESDQMLMLFLYRADKISVMQNWLLRGICIASDWDEDAEEDGLIRFWVESKITDLPDECDWAVKERVNRILKETEKTLFVNVLEEVINAFDNERDKETAKELAFLQSIYFEFRGRKRFKKKTRKIERAVNALDDISCAIIKMRYFDKTDMEIIIKKAFMVRSAVYKRIDKAFEQMAYFIANIA